MKKRHRYVKKDLGDLLEAVALVHADVLILRELIGSRQRIDNKFFKQNSLFHRKSLSVGERVAPFSRFETGCQYRRVATQHLALSMTCPS